MTDPADDRMWRTRWMVMNVVSIGGFVFAGLGLLIWRKGIFGFQDPLAGKVIFVIGVVEALLLPRLLRRAWRSKDDVQR